MSDKGQHGSSKCSNCFSVFVSQHSYLHTHLHSWSGLIAFLTAYNLLEKWREFMPGQRQRYPKIRQGHTTRPSRQPTRSQPTCVSAAIWLSWTARTVWSTCTACKAFTWPTPFRSSYARQLQPTTRTLRMGSSQVPRPANNNADKAHLLQEATAQMQVHITVSSMIAALASSSSMAMVPAFKMALLLQHTVKEGMVASKVLNKGMMKGKEVQEQARAVGVVGHCLAQPGRGAARPQPYNAAARRQYNQGPQLQSQTSAGHDMLGKLTGLTYCYQ